MIMVALVGHILQPNFDSVSAERVDLASRIPVAFMGWREDKSIAPIAPDRELQEGVERLYVEVLARTYVDQHGNRVMLSVAYGGRRSRALQVHRPEGCYASQGFVVSLNDRRSIDLGDSEIPVLTLIATRDQRNEPITYWIRLGDVVVSGWRMQTEARLRYGLQRIVPDEVLFRVSSIDSDNAKGLTMQERFVRDLIPSLDKRTRTFLIGGVI
jgi:EpsI family protein